MPSNIKVLLVDDNPSSSRKQSTTQSTQGFWKA
jgi:hypothetical protein